VPHYGLATAPRIALWTLLGALSLPGAAHAGPDDWSLTHERDDAQLVSQRMGKLRRNPFDGGQWNALRRAVGGKALASKIAAALERAPDDVALQILDARAKQTNGDPSAGAARLAALDGKAGRWEAAAFSLRIDMHVAASEHATAVVALDTLAGTVTGAARSKLLTRAFRIAESGNLDDAALALARKLAEGDPDHADRLRLARAASRAGEAAEADRVYAEAITHASRRDRDELVAERARARLDGDNAAGASALWWELLDSPGVGTKSARETWWDSLAEAHHRDGSTDVLVARLGRWVDDHPSEAAAWRALAQARESAGMDPAPAWRRVLELEPRDTASHASLIDALDAQGDPDAATSEYETLSNRNPREVELGLELASRRMAAGQRAEALRLVAAIEDRVGRHSRELMLVLDFYNLNDEPELALGIARRLVDLAPRKVETRVALGEQLYQMGRVTEALDQWGHIPGLVRPKHAGWAKQAEILAEHGRTAEAVTSLGKALKVEPEEPAYLRLRAVLAEDQRRPGTALGLWETVRRLATAPEQKLLRDEARTRVVDLLVGGAINHRRVQLETVERQARATLDLGSPREDAIEAGRLLAELYTRQEDYSSAVAVQQQLLLLSPDDPSRLTQLASAQRRAGQVESAMGTLEELLASEPKRKADVLAEMSELAFEAGDADGALDSATRAARRDRTQLDALLRLGQMHERNGDVSQARRAYETALEIDADDGHARLRLAELELTEGRDDKAADALRDVLEGSGPPELVREAGRRALDLAEANGSTMELFEVAVDRTSKRPEAGEPRGLLLDALNRADRDAVQTWIVAGGDATLRTTREGALRQPLVASLNRGTVGARLRAAEHLGWLGLPDTAVPLAKMGATLSAPRDSTSTVRDAFERARVTAIHAAGALREPSSVPTLAALVQDASQSGAARHAAGWALAEIGTKEAAAALADQLRWRHDSMLASLACAALSQQRRADVDDAHFEFVQKAAREAGHDEVGQMCSFALAALTDDRRADRWIEQLQSSDPTTAAIAAWRLGRVETPSAEVLEALLTRYVGPPGTARDAAGSALANLLNDHAQPNEIEGIPAPPRGGAWRKAINRWLAATLTPEVTPLSADAFAPHVDRLEAALRQAAVGTRAEREAAAAVVDDCDPPGQAGRFACLSPLASDPIPLPVRD
jgi:tetratricopeptide (TPR) repeat protein